MSFPSEPPSRARAVPAFMAGVGGSNLGSAPRASQSIDNSDTDEPPQMEFCHAPRERATAEQARRQYLECIVSCLPFVAVSSSLPSQPRRLDMPTPAGPELSNLIYVHFGQINSCMAQNTRHP
jgi:hypothetical protein